MRGRNALATFRPRLRSPLLLALAGIWAFFSLSGVLFNRLLSPELTGLQPWTHPLLLDLLWVVWSPISLFFLSPIPWLWTGDDRPQTGFLRGLLQALPIPLMEAVFTALVYFPMKDVDLPPGAMPALLSLHVAEWLFIGSAVAAWEQRKARKSAALVKTREAQWTLLHSQMSPHAFLNALNGLAQLVTEDLQAGLKGIRDLSEIYRLLLEHGESQLLPLGRERDLLSRFLGVEALRLGQRLKVEWDWDPDLDRVPLPPLLLQPLVENAVKHGIASSESGGTLRIGARRDGRDLRLTVANTGLPLGHSSQEGTGIGLRNLEARLRLAFGSEAELTLKTDGAWTLAEIHLIGSRP